MNYSKKIKNDFTAGNGVCVTLFVSGCALRCPGCHNPESWDPNAGMEFTQDSVQEILDALCANNIYRNLCLMGGEPLHQNNRLEILQLILQVKEKYPNIKIYLWTGNTYENLCKSPSPIINNILNCIDYLIDGPFIQEERDITLKMRGSRNQRILELKNGQVINELQ